MRNIVYAIFLLFLMISVSEISTGVFATIFEYHKANLDSSTAGVIRKSEVDIFGSWATTEYDICYFYYVKAKKYEGCRISYDLDLCDDCNAIQKYPVGREVTVYYDSKNPSYASLEKGSLGKRVYRQLAVLVIFYPAVLLIGFVYRDSGKKTRKGRKGRTR